MSASPGLSVFFPFPCSNPTNVDGDYCLGSYGGPVLPYTALGGYLQEGEVLALEPEYTESTALIITILISNHVDKDKLGPALAWEKRYTTASCYSCDLRCASLVSS